MFVAGRELNCAEFGFDRLLLSFTGLFGKSADRRIFEHVNEDD